MKIKNILLSILAMFMLFACSTNKPMILVNNDISISKSHINKTYSKIEKLGLDRIKEKNRTEIKEILDIFIEPLSKELGIKIDNKDAFYLINKFLNSYKYELKSISYISENEVDLEYLVKIPDLTVLADWDKNKELEEKINEAINPKMQLFILTNFDKLDDESAINEFVLKNIAPIALDEAISYLEKNNKYLETNSFVSLKKENDDWKLIKTTNSDKIDREYATLINSKIRVDEKYVDKTKKEVHEKIKTAKHDIFNLILNKKDAKDREILEFINENTENEIKSIYFISKDKIFVRQEIKIFDIYNLIYESIKSDSNNENSKIDDAEFIINQKTKYFTHYLILEKKDDKWVIVPSMLEKTLIDKLKMFFYEDNKIKDFIN
ncbi:hypothetical protein [Oceanivirga salmonicida]|uniref:hypothetical protein n=1 Tax=Oceanivirga salmonicida TaxID=1769291 RepID=UPI00082B17D3|nr:hypothetical protein [Oceanivirga salmonicida]